MCVRCAGRPSSASMVCQRRLDVAGHAEVAAVDVQRMRHAELVQRARQRVHHLARRDLPVHVRLVDVELALVELEGRDAARVDHLHAHRLAGVASSSRRSRGCCSKLRVGRLGQHAAGTARRCRASRRRRGRGSACRPSPCGRGARCSPPSPARRPPCSPSRHSGSRWPACRARSGRTTASSSGFVGSAIGLAASRWSSGISRRARLTLPPPMWVCMSMPPAITMQPLRVDDLVATTRRGRSVDDAAVAHGQVAHARRCRWPGRSTRPPRSTQAAHALACARSACSDARCATSATRRQRVGAAPRAAASAPSRRCGTGGRRRRCPAWPPG